MILIRNAAATDFGGGERVPVFIARELSSYNIQPIVFSRSYKLLAFAKSENVAFRRTLWWSKQNWSGPYALLFPVYVVWQLVLFFYYVALFLRIKPGAVHIQSKDDFIAATIAARVLKINVFWSDYADLKHVWRNHKIWYKNPVGKLVYWAAKFAATIVVVSKEDKRAISELIPNGLIKNKLNVIYNGTFDDYRDVKKNKQFTFISTARLVTDKGIGELILAFKKLRSEFKDIRLELVGDGPKRSHFESLAKGESSIKFLGYKSDPLDYVARSDVFVLATYHEGFSIALLEAFMEGVSVIATNVGGNPEIITDGRTGLLVDAKNVDELYEAMVRLYKDAALRMELGKNARAKYLSAYNFKTIIKDEFLPLYEATSS